MLLLTPIASKMQENAHLCFQSFLTQTLVFSISFLIRSPDWKMLAAAQFTLPVGVGFNVGQTPNLRSTPPSRHHFPRRTFEFSGDSALPNTIHLSSKQLESDAPLRIPAAWAGGGSGVGKGSGGGGGNDGRGAGGDREGLGFSWGGFGFIGAFINGWRDRVAADPQFPFKVLMEELVGVGSSTLGDMSSRPNFGLNELDFVFSTLVVGLILNFLLMYLLAPTTSSLPQVLPSIFANCPPSYMFQPGPYTLIDRLGTLVYKGIVFAAVGFPAGLLGTAITNGLITMRKKMDPSFETPNKPPPTLLNASTWALHMGISSNLRYQTLNGVEFLLAKALPSPVFKVSVFVLRLVNNVVGGMTFVMLARFTGSQKVGKVEGDAAAKEKLLNKEETASSSN